MEKVFRVKRNRFSKLSRWTIVYTIFLSGILLYPFTFRDPVHIEKNDVKWISEKNGVEFSSIGGIFSISPPEKLFNALSEGDGFTIEVWLSTENYQQTGPARIVSYSFDPLYRNFTLGQEGRDLVMRLRTEKSNLNGTNPEIILRNTFISDNPYHITVTYDLEEERIYINGEIQLQTEALSGTFSNWDSTYSLVIGNEMTGNRPWIGRIYLVAIYQRALSSEDILMNYMAERFNQTTSSHMENRINDGLIALYLFDEKNGHVIRDRSWTGSDLLMPYVLRIPNASTYKAFLMSDFSSGAEGSEELILNILAFMLLGYLLFKSVRRRYVSSLKSTAIVLLMGIFFSLVMESLQYYVESRGSEMIDVISGTSGILLGILICNIFDRVIRSF